MLRPAAWGGLCMMLRPAAWGQRLPRAGDWGLLGPHELCCAVHHLCVRPCFFCKAPKPWRCLAVDTSSREPPWPLSLPWLGSRGGLSLPWLGGRGGLGAQLGE